ncbi:hypothetical protein HYT56_02725 [Candidatus Woesearchaeota archaeon]|nr:hypothetical protein [Candidatus Woesearchaeota archaeon]
MSRRDNWPRGRYRFHDHESITRIMRVIREKKHLPSAAIALGYKNRGSLCDTLGRFYLRHPLLKDGVNAIIQDNYRCQHIRHVRNIVATVLGNYCYLRSAAEELGYRSVQSLEVTMSQIYSEFPRTKTTPGLKRIIQRNREMAKIRGYRD